ncbi:MAG TPA: hypothetical protein VFF06_28685 [Polyangia bacterium]|nr:hypothetical protein [Polyangia bacterium]
MDLPKQKNFYDNRRPFQGKDNPTDVHPDPKLAGAPIPRGQLIFGVVFFAFVAALFWLRVRSEAAPSPSQILPPKASAPAAPAKP